MKIERGEVEKMLSACEPGSDTFLQVTEELTRRKLRALCRTWLRVEDAPRALLTTDSESCDGEEIVELSPFTIQDEKAIEAMHRKRVRLVRDGGE